VAPRIFPTVGEAPGRLGQHVNVSTSTCQRVNTSARQHADASRGPIVDEATLIDSARYMPAAGSTDPSNHADAR
jgi:hypothetical protein